ncbi:MAG: hypothetical protein QXP04_03910 [Candidatus Nanoarchaeia archaeon]|nr:hypothetical protein [Candidatus Jingweiarchaeum tengchongense]
MAAHKLKKLDRDKIKQKDISEIIIMCIVLALIVIFIITLIMNWQYKMTIIPTIFNSVMIIMIVGIMAWAVYKEFIVRQGMQ